MKACLPANLLALHVQPFITRPFRYPGLPAISPMPSHLALPGQLMHRDLYGHPGPVLANLLGYREGSVNRYAPVFLPVGETLKTVIRDMDDIIGSYRLREREMLQAIGVAAQHAAIAQARLNALNSLPPRTS